MKPISQLTRQEAIVFQLLVDFNGDYTQIASKLVISKTTVKTHINNIFQKLYAKSKIQAVMIGLREGLIHLNPQGEERTHSDAPIANEHNADRDKAPVCIFI